jgi:hypothetical protein
MTSVSKDASTTRLLVIGRLLGRLVVVVAREAARFADVSTEVALKVFFKGDGLCTSFVLDLERVFRGERRDGPA